jgi:hypothetical protein
MVLDSERDTSLLLGTQDVPPGEEMRPLAALRPRLWLAIRSSGISVAAGERTRQTWTSHGRVASVIKHLGT